MANPDDEEGFLRRWSRLKRATESAAAPPTAADAAVPDLPSPVLGDVEKLDFSSDFAPFLRAKVEESVKRAALKKLFHAPHFNQMDGLDVYIDDYGKFEPIGEDVVKQLAHARDLLFREEPDIAQPEAGEVGNAQAPAASEPSAGMEVSRAIGAEPSSPADAGGRSDAFRQPQEAKPDSDNR